MSNLMILFLGPFLLTVILFVTPIYSSKQLKVLAVLMTFFPLAFLLFHSNTLIGSEVNQSWIPSLFIQFHLIIDSLSLIFLYLVAIITPFSCLAVRRSSLLFPKTFYGLILLLQGLLIGFFTSRDLLFFTIFWEAMLLPLYFMMIIWGGAQRQMASLKFLIYMIAGSALMVMAVLALYMAAQSINGIPTFNIDALASLSSVLPYANWIGLIFLLAFAVKTPLFPFHAWLPDAYCQASIPGTILLSAILSKAGIYGFLRIGMEIFPSLMHQWSLWLLTLAIAGVFYGALAAWRQNDFKRLMAYSSFSHVNFILVGIFTWSEVSHSGAILQAFNHGITITGLFLVVGWLEERMGSTSMDQVSGLAKYFPYLCWFTLFFVLSSVALPGTNNFVGELMILFGLFRQNYWLAAFLGLIVVLSVVYLLHWMQKVYFGRPSLYRDTWNDIKSKQMIIALPLIALIIWVGLYPAPLLKQTNLSVKKVSSSLNREGD